MNFDLKKEMDLDPHLLFNTNNSDKQDNKLIIEVDKEEAEQLLQGNETPTMSKSTKTSMSSRTIIANDLKHNQLKRFWLIQLPTCYHAQGSLRSPERCLPQ
jgi:hypothetical protein